MKNKIYYFGIACCIIILLGGIFKIQHWPGAGICLTLSILLLVFVFLPMAMINSFKAEENKKIRILYITGYIAFGFDLIAGLFKLMHWPGASILMTIGIPLPFILFLPAYLLYVRKDKNVNYNHLLTVLFFFAYFGAFTAIMALDISKNMVDEMVVNATQTNKTNRNLKIQNQIFNDYLKNKPIENSVRKSIQQINENTEELCSYMDDLKSAMIKVSESQCHDAKNMNYQKISNKNNRFASNAIMLNKEKGKELLQKFDNYKKFLISESKITDKTTLNFIKEVLTTNGKGEFSWNEGVFRERHMIAALGYIDILKKRVLMSRMEALMAISER
jgi:hypothetical protein